MTSPNKTNSRSSKVKRLSINNVKKTKFWTGIAVTNFLVIIVFLFILLRTPASTNTPVSSNKDNKIISVNIINPLDQVSSSQIAQTVSSVTNMPESTAVKNQNETVSAEQSQSVATNNVSAKPQIVETAFVSKNDIKTYTVQPGDTLASVAAKFNITSNSILWSNNISKGNLVVGSKILIPPVSGIVYTVKSGDTLNSLATKYGSNLDQLTAYNDAEINGISIGEQILIPNGQPPAAPAYNFFFPTYGSGSSNNGYDFGYCTWYVATQIAVPSNWGNASSWAYYARLSGWNVSSIPTVGSIAQTPYAAGGQGHVAIVKAISGDQIYIEDMNGIAGYDRVGRGWEPIAKYPNYISR